MNLSSESNGQDYGWYDSKTTNAAIDAAYNTQDPSQRNAKWGDLSESLAKEVAYVGLDIEKFLRLHGSGVTNYVETPSSNGYPDMGQLGTTSS